jgi:glyoxylase-like metal-dependent hydrolase (beta-lactamase superfamily II)
MMIWLVRGGGKNILVDTGCYHENVVKGKGIQNLIKASDAIAKLGLAATDITDVVITHMHWDHADGMTCFPTRRFDSERRIRLLHRRRVAAVASTEGLNPMTC